jgi:hypothetical protein
VTTQKKLSRIRALKKQDENIIHDLQFVADEVQRTNGLLRLLASEALTYKPRERWYHYLVPRCCRLQPVAAPEPTP